jgi:outer membrane protein OmpU
MRYIIGISSALCFAAPGFALADISLFGDARLGIGYNIFNDGEQRQEEKRSVTVEGETPEEVVTVLGPADDLRAVSRVRFGVNMTGETDSGIAFGASIRADNAQGGQGGDVGQRSGEVFVSGAWGTLTFGDIDGADYARVGDPIGNATLTGLGDFNELPFLSNGGGSDNDELQFLTNPDVRPTVRFDYDLGDFGLSASTTRDLNDFGLGASYGFEFAEGAISVGAGYYSFEEFTGDIPNLGEFPIPGGEQWSGSLTGSYGMFVGGVGFTSIDAGDAGKLDVLSGGVGANYEAWSIRTYYSTVTSGDETFGAALDGADSYGASLSYDLGGGARVAMGVARTYGADATGVPGDAVYTPKVQRMTLADFGIAMNF